jgi:membrane-associated phospholipid phosphatase
MTHRITALRFRAVDVALMVYLCSITAALLLCRPAGVWIPAFAIHTAMAATVVVLAWCATARRSGVCHFLYRWYPQLWFLILFEEVHFLVHMLRRGWFDAQLIAFDLWLFGAHPTVWIERIARPWVTEIMQAAYFSYFLMLPVVGGCFYLQKRWREFESLMAADAAAYVVCYTIFYLYPIEGPAHTLAALQTVQLKGGAFVWLMDLIEKFGRVHGGAFPSAHVVGTLVPWFAARRYAPRLAWVLAPAAAGVLAATVYGRYHYVADVLAGIIIAVTASACTGFFARKAAACLPSGSSALTSD